MPELARFPRKGNDTPRGVLHVALSKRYGGADVRVAQLAAAMSPRLRTTVVCILGSGLQERLTAERVHHVAVRTGRGDPRTGHAIAELLRTGRYDVVDAHNPQSQWWGLLAAQVTRTPGLVMTAHSQYRHEHGSGTVRGHGYEAVLRAGRRAGAHFVAVSDATAAYLRGIGVPDDRIAVIPNAIPRTTRATPDDGVVPSEWPGTALVLGTVGRLEPVKGLPDLLQALAHVRADGVDARLVMVGDGRSRAELEETVARLDLHGAVAFAGFRRDVERVLPRLDVFCQPSLSEGLPFALLEAAAAARPVLVTGVGEVPQVVRDRDTGLVVPPSDPAALADGLRWMAANPEARTAMGAALHDDVTRRYSVEALAEHTLEVYRAATSAP